MPFCPYPSPWDISMVPPIASHPLVQPFGTMLPPVYSMVANCSVPCLPHTFLHVQPPYTESIFNFNLFASSCSLHFQNVHPPRQPLYHHLIYIFSSLPYSFLTKLSVTLSFYIWSTLLTPLTILKHLISTYPPTFVLFFCVGSWFISIQQCWNYTIKCTHLCPIRSDLCFYTFVCVPRMAASSSTLWLTSTSMVPYAAIFISRYQKHFFFLQVLSIKNHTPANLTLHCWTW